MRLSEVHWISAGQLNVFKEHNIETLEQLASFALRDSAADVVPVDGLRALARRARATLSSPDPLEQVGQAAGARGAVRYAGNVRFSDGR